MKKIFVFGIVLLLLLNICYASEYYFETEQGDSVTIKQAESFWEKIKYAFSGSVEETIYPAKATIKIGEPNKITLGIAVPCNDATGRRVYVEDITAAKFVMTAPNGAITTYDFKPKIQVCSSVQVEYTVLPVMVGTYTIHYSIIQKFYPSILVKEVSSFNVVKDEVVCDKEVLSAWTPVYDVANGKLFQRFRHYYDNNCYEITNQRQIIYKTVCNTGFVISGTSLQEAEGKRSCEALSVPKPIPSPTPSPEPTPTPETCPPTCDIFCEHGKKVDDKGCSTCECNLPPILIECSLNTDCEGTKVCVNNKCVDQEEPAPDSFQVFIKENALLLGFLIVGLGLVGYLIAKRYSITRGKR